MDFTLMKGTAGTHRAGAGCSDASLGVCRLNRSSISELCVYVYLCVWKSKELDRRQRRDASPISHQLGATA